MIRPLMDHHGAMLISKHKNANVFLHFNKATQEKEQKGVLKEKESFFIITATFPQLYFIHI